MANFSEPVNLLPHLSDEDEDHPEPYYMGAEVTFPAVSNVPWLAEERKRSRELLQVKQNNNFSSSELIN